MTNVIVNVKENQDCEYESVTMTTRRVRLSSLRALKMTAITELES